ncbi:MAG: response regulator [Melioribacteraceae bacterium]|nr:MAG: response regulator [Melioribacteraceae bacterium]
MSKKILVIEDDPGDQKLIQMVFNKVSNNIRIDIIDDGELAFNRIKDETSQFDYDMIILDLNLPKVEGLTLLQAIKSSEITKDVFVVIFTTASRGSIGKDDVIELADAFFTKPSKLKEFVELFSSLFEKLNKQVVKNV